VATLDTQDTGRRQTKHTHTKQALQIWVWRYPTKTRGEHIRSGRI